LAAISVVVNIVVQVSSSGSPPPAAGLADLSAFHCCATSGPCPIRAFRGRIHHLSAWIAGDLVRGLLGTSDAGMDRMMPVDDNAVND
jgi:hypothetical protein